MPIMPLAGTVATSLLIETGSAAGEGVNYATFEQPTGKTWINGKRVYQVTTSWVSGQANVNGLIDMPVDGLETVIDVRGFTVSTMTSPPTFTGLTATWIVNVAGTSANSWGFSGMQSTNGWATIWYTKA